MTSSKPIMKFLERIGVVKRRTLHLKITKSQLLEYLFQNIRAGEDEVAIIDSTYLYFGDLGDAGFSITETISLLKNTSAAVITGRIYDYSSEIKLELKSVMLASREYVFLASGVLMIAVGFIKAITAEGFNLDDSLMILVGFFSLFFTFLYMRRDARKALDKIEKRILQIQS